MINRILLPVLLAMVLVACDTLGQEQLPPQELAEEEARFINVDGIEVYIDEQGPQEGEAVMLLHGFGGSTFQWRQTQEKLSRAGYRTIAYDRPGAGLSGKPADFDYSFENQAFFLTRIMNELNVERAVIIGHSQGGRVLAEFAIRYPERITQLVIVSGAILSGGNQAIADLNLSGQLPAVLLSSEFIVETFGAVLQGLATEDRLRTVFTDIVYDPASLSEDTIQGYLEPFRVEDWQNGLLYLTRDADLASMSRDHLARIVAPTLLIWGKEDTVVPFEQGQSLNNILANATVLAYENVGHLPMEEVPARFNNNILEFLVLYQN